MKWHDKFGIGSLVSLSAVAGIGLVYDVFWFFWR